MSGFWVRNYCCLYWLISFCLFARTYSVSVLTIIPTDHLVFAQQSKPAFVVGEVHISDDETGGAVVELQGNCNYCLELENSLNGTFQIHPKANSWRDCYTNAISKSRAEDGPLKLQYCQAQFKLSNDVVLERRISVNQSPVITETSDAIIEIEENVNNMFVFSIRTTDPDQNNISFAARRLQIKSCIDQPERACLWTLYRGTFECGQNHACNYFGTDVFDVTINLTTPLDYEIERVHSLQLEILDAYTLNNSGIQNSLWQSVTVRVLDVQDTPPFWTSIPALPFVDECTEPGTEVFRVRAIDGDLGVRYPSNITYSLIQIVNETAAELPVLNVTTSADGAGIVTVARTFSIEEFVSSDGYIMVNLTAIEVETNQVSEPLILQVLVRDVDNNRPLLYLLENATHEVLSDAFDARIEENAIVRTPVELTLPGSQICVRDDDMGENAKFTISLVPDDTFEVSPLQGQGSACLTVRVKDNRLLDAEMLQNMSITIVVWGTTSVAKERGPTNATINVDIVDVNDEASFIQYTDENGNSLTCNSSSFSWEVEETIYQRKPQSILNMYNNVTNITDADRDDINRRHVSFRDRSYDQPSFTVTTEGVLQVIGPLDYETAPNHMHAVAYVVENRGRNEVLMTSECTVNVLLIDVNDELPVITSASVFSIDENTGGVLGMINANDLDASANLTFAITVDRAEKPNGVSLQNVDSLTAHFAFVVEELADGQSSGNRSASLQVVKPLDREETQTIYATIVVTDENGDERGPQFPQTDSKLIVITVNDINDNPPQLRYGDQEVGGNFTIDFPELPFRQITRDFVVTDPDSIPNPPNFQPQLTEFSNTEYANHVTVERTELNKIRLTVVQPFNYDLIQRLTFLLIVYDDDPENTSDNHPVLNTTTLIIFDILNANNHPPVIISPEDGSLFEIDEADGRLYNSSNADSFQPMETDIHVMATDQDAPDFLPLKYLLSFKQAPELAGKLRIDEWSGKVSVVQPIDREERGFDGTFVLLLQVIDNANETFNYQTSETRQIRIKIRDVNDNEPYFQNVTEATSVVLLPKDNRAGYELPFKHQATDLDEPETCGKLVYSLTPTASSDSLEINSVTGIVKLRAPLTGTTLNFEVHVFDGSVAPQCSPGHLIGHSRLIKILGTEEVQQLRVNIEKDDEVQKQLELDALNAKMEEIGGWNGYIYLFRALSDPKPKSSRVKREKGQQVLDYSYVSATFDPVPADKINKMLSAHQTELAEVGVTSIGEPQTIREGKSENVDDKWIVIGVLIGLLVVTMIMTGALVVEKVKLNRKLHVYKSSAVVEQTENGANRYPTADNSSFSPYLTGSELKTNPIMQRFGNVDMTFGATEDADDFELVDGMILPDGTQSESSKENATTGLDNFEARLASSNRNNLQNH